MFVLIFLGQISLLEAGLIGPIGVGPEPDALGMKLPPLPLPTLKVSVGIVSQLSQ